MLWNCSVCVFCNFFFIVLISSTDRTGRPNWHGIILRHNSTVECTLLQQSCEAMKTVRRAQRVWNWKPAGSRCIEHTMAGIALNKFQDDSSAHRSWETLLTTSDPRRSIGTWKRSNERGTNKIVPATFRTQLELIKTLEMLRLSSATESADRLTNDQS